MGEPHPNTNTQVRSIFLNAKGKLDRGVWVEFQRLMATYAQVGLARAASSLCAPNDLGASGEWIAGKLRQASEAVEREVHLAL